MQISQSCWWCRVRDDLGFFTRRNAQRFGVNGDAVCSPRDNDSRTRGNGVDGSIGIYRHSLLALLVRYDYGGGFREHLFHRRVDVQDPGTHPHNGGLPNEMNPTVSRGKDIPHVVARRSRDVKNRASDRRPDRERRNETWIT